MSKLNSSNRIIYASRRVNATVDRFIRADTPEEHRQARRWAEAWALAGNLKTLHLPGILAKQPDDHKLATYIRAPIQFTQQKPPAADQLKLRMAQDRIQLLQREVCQLRDMSPWPAIYGAIALCTACTTIYLLLY